MLPFYEQAGDGDASSELVADVGRADERVRRVAESETEFIDAAAECVVRRLQ
jgi:hypothetical protein